MNRVTRLRIFGVLAALTMVLSHGIGQAKPVGGPRTIKLQSAKSGWVEVRIAKTATISPSQVYIKAAGDYGGFAIFRKGSTEGLVGQVDFRNEDGASRVHFNDPSDSPILSPGRYIFYILTSGKTTVEIRTAGLSRDISLKKFKAVKDQTMMVEPGAPTTSASDFTVGARTVIVNGARLTNAMAAYEFCITAVDEECLGIGSEPGAGTLRAGVARGKDAGTHSTEYPGQDGHPEPGEYEMVYRIFGSGMPAWEKLGYAIAFDLVK